MSLPESLARVVRKTVEERHYASVSEYLRDLIRFDNSEKLLKQLKQQTKDFEKGKGVLLKSWDQLDK